MNSLTHLFSKLSFFLFISNFCFAQLVSSNLPIIIIETNDDIIVNDPKIKVGFKVLYHTDGSQNYLTDTDYHYNGYAGIELHGTSSQAAPKKSYSFELRNILDESVKFGLLGFPEESDWVLIANYDDKTHIKNAYIYDLWKKTNEYSPRTKFVEVVINGEYMGLYVFTEKIKRDTNRINIKKLEEKDTTIAKISGGYIIEASRETDVLNVPNIWVSNYLSSPASNYKMSFECKYPKKPNTQQANYIKNYINDFETSLKSENFKDPILGFRKYVDENSFVENFIFQEYAISYDIFSRSQYLYKERDSKLKASPIWDVNPGLFDNYATSWRFSCNNCDPRFFWVERMMQDCAFKSNVIAKYKDFRLSFLSIEKSYRFIDSLANIIQDAAARDSKKWFPTDNVSFSNEIQKLKNFVSIRLNWMDLNIHDIVDDGEDLVSLGDNAKTNQMITLITGCSNTNPIKWRFENSDGTSGTFVGTNIINVLISQSVTYNAICQVDGCTRYSNTQHITFNNDCLDEIDFTSHYIYPPVQQFDTKYIINSSAKLNPSSKINYATNKSIFLNPGFQVSSGSVFTAKIGGCQ
ncbi:CotH kinase family protein [Emticicia sp. SJ17W-69]|uniref:CotH kinase family protein n=1 Tax=Emticicia sp. SJ17W-69 TaxID=3421657 RepID=UPI003EB82DA1